jgi:EAL domain-containing protein (putative c-di-GMP-specific phosphodiesterase class I)
MKATTTSRRTFGRIRGYLRGEGLSMAFQPIAELHTGAVVGFESLARFDGRPPETWFDQAATAGLRRELELAAARAAIRSLKDLPEGAYLTINASPDVAMLPAFLETVSGTGGRVVVEITEHAPIDDYEALNVALRELRARGVRVAIDDAGAGFANVTHMLRIDADLIKLDVELTRHIDIDVRRRAMVASLVEFSRSVGATLVAEGIETEAELVALRELGVQVGQGYHLGRPAALPSAATRPAAAGSRDPLWRSVANAVGDAASFALGRGRQRRRSVALRVALVLTVALVFGPATLAVAENASPGTPGYWLKRRVEDVRLLVALDRDGELRLHMQFARRRLNELNRAVADGNPKAVEMAVAGYRDHVDKVDRALPNDPTMSAGMNRWVSDELSDYIEALEREMSDGCAAPGRAKKAECFHIEQAAKRSKATLDKVKKLPSGKGAAVVQPGPVEKPDLHEPVLPLQANKKKKDKK